MRLRYAAVSFKRCTATDVENFRAVIIGSDINYLVAVNDDISTAAVDCDCVFSEVAANCSVEVVEASRTWINGRVENSLNHNA